MTADIALRRKPPSEAEEDLNSFRKNRDLSFQDLVSIDQVTQKDLELIYDVARRFRDYRTYKFSFNKGYSQVNAFFEPSTRTSSSFDLAAKQLSMDTAGVSANSSLQKGESYLDTIETIDAYNVKVIVIRSKESGVPEMAARHTQASIVNAGDGWHEHPTQALLDGLTMLDHFGSKDMKGKTVTIVGDITHSRVFGSLVRLLKMLKAEIRVAAPLTLLPKEVEKFGVKTFVNIEEALSSGGGSASGGKGADVVYALRVQSERGANGFIPSLREYSKMFGISRKRLDLASKDAILMHPGPVIRDIDVHSALAAVDEQSHILRQVENGMAVRKALLWLLCDRIDGKTKEFVRK
ncbi:aspartate carbamoyltransferase catalytic subunit [Candidatus Kaiserbacteria bacterium]|nr:aspartate carbamoyltransferase catalytic subunit [Candidatus Kaiserbacteria bacterium]